MLRHGLARHAQAGTDRCPPQGAASGEAPQQDEVHDQWGSGCRKWYHESLQWVAGAEIEAQQSECRCHCFFGRKEDFFREPILHCEVENERCGSAAEEHRVESKVA